MKKILAITTLTVALGLGGCANLQNAWSVITQTTVPPAAAIVTANAFDTLTAGATAYLTYCKTNLTTSVCSADNRRTVIKTVRAGRPIRAQVEGYITTQTNIPSAVYNAFLSIVNTLNSTPAATFGTGASQ